jgi:hypothetical protein
MLRAAAANPGAAPLPGRGAQDTAALRRPGGAVHAGLPGTRWGAPLPAAHMAPSCMPMTALVTTLVACRLAGAWHDTPVALGIPLLLSLLPWPGSRCARHAAPAQGGRWRRQPCAACAPGRGRPISRSPGRLSRRWAGGCWGAGDVGVCGGGAGGAPPLGRRPTSVWGCRQPVACVFVGAGDATARHSRPGTGPCISTSTSARCC